MLSHKTVLSQEPELPSTEIDGEVVLMSSQTGRYYSLAGSAACIWKELAGETTIDAICASLTTRYEVDEKTCRVDVTEFVALLAQHKLIRTAEV